MAGLNTRKYVLPPAVETPPPRQRRRVRLGPHGPHGSDNMERGSQVFRSALALIALGSASSCVGTPATSKEHPQQLVGTWQDWETPFMSRDKKALQSAL